MLKNIKSAFRVLAILALCFLGYIVVVLTHGTLTDWQPEAETVLEVKGQADTTAIPDTALLQLISWNVGYAGLGAQSTFFYDSGHNFFSHGKMVRPPRPLTDKNIQGVSDFLPTLKPDFVLLQEVDKASRRSYYLDEEEIWAKALPNYARTFALNYNCVRVPLPVCEPWSPIGKTFAGVTTFSKYQPLEAKRYQLPGKYSWPTRIFQLDRCLDVSRFKVSNGKQLVVVNLHNSAYDPGGVLKKQEIEFLKRFLLAEYGKGNYVVCGGDWNQTPPYVGINFFMSNGKTDYVEADYPAIEPELMPEDWVWAFDPTTPTNRSLVDVYNPKETFITLIDYFLISPNLQLKEARAINNEFEFSDHQPVTIKIALKK